MWIRQEMMQVSVVSQKGREARVCVREGFVQGRRREGSVVRRSTGFRQQKGQSPECVRSIGGHLSNGGFVTPEDEGFVRTEVEVGILPWLLKLKYFHVL